MFERAVSTLPIEYQRPIWAKLLQHETNYGEFALTKSLEARQTETFAELDFEDNQLAPLLALSKRYSFFGQSFVGDIELGVPGMSIW